MPTHWRIIDTASRDPFTNMAFDEALLRGYALQGVPTLRIYGWEPAGISIGFSQDPARDLDLERCRREGMPFVRRLTGGGAIAHGHELTYSLVSSKSDLGIPARVVSSYKVISSFLITFYKKLGLDAAFAGDRVSGERLGVPSALCFASKEKYDIVIAGRKIGGSAQKRTGDRIFQHGSIPVRIDRTQSFARGGPALSMAGATSLEELLGRYPDYRELSTLLVESFTATFGVSVEKGDLTDAEAALGEELRVKKYASDDWNLRRCDVPDLTRLVQPGWSNLVGLTRLER